jgi:hypothetical protein
MKGVKYDKFYTKNSIAKKCINIFKKYIKIDKHNDLIIEPSAGNGVFIPYIKKMSKKYLFIDIKPESKYIIKQNYLSYIHSKILNKYSKIHIIGNPPFGKKSSLAIKFIKKSAMFADSIAFILPKSFKKNSLKKSVPLKFHLIYEIDLPYNSFTLDGDDYDVPCVFQIWKKMPYDRKKFMPQISKYFSFVKKNDKPDLSIRRIGFNAGRIDANTKDKNINSHYFIKLKKKYNKNKLINSLMKNKYNTFNNTVGPRSISKQEIIIHYNSLRL